MGSLGMQEIIVIFVLALIIFGPRKLPEIGKSIGKGLSEFRKASNELRQTWGRRCGWIRKKKPSRICLKMNLPRRKTLTLNEGFREGA